ncbi:MAG: tRNA (adenosine(37)-N6)-threonylcarbamoyltransferase complex transferase subunit TsaD [Candidatus Limnocylindrus sp.]
MRDRLLLAIESSCDESAVALVRDGRAVLAERVASQTAVHAPFGGVIPEVAARAHHEWLPRLLNEVLLEAERLGVAGKIEGVALTTGPGLVGSLLVGAGVGSAWAWARGLPVLPVNHLEGHLRAAWLTDAVGAEEPKLPAIGLVVSGGHTLLVRIERDGAIQRLGGTIDDAAGEAFDKIARILGAPYPGGAALSALAANVPRGTLITPLPIAKTEQPYDFSFSGVKTAAIRQALASSGLTNHSPGRAATLTRQFAEHPLSPAAAIAIAAATEQAIVGALRAGVQRALREHPECSLIVGGGVAANGPLRAALTSVATEEHRTLVVPPLKWCTDNAAMIGAAGDALLRDERGTYQEPSRGVEVHAQWRIGTAVPA